MSAFNANTRMFCGLCCGSSVYEPNSPGISIRFDKPWDSGEAGRQIETIQTSVGPVYIKLNLDNKYHGRDGVYYGYIPEPVLGPRTADEEKPLNPLIEHYTCKEITDGLGVANVGLAIAADNYEEYVATANRYTKQGSPNQAKVYQDYADLHKDSDIKVREYLTSNGILLYESPRFFNMTHKSRDKPSLTFFVYDKGLLNGAV